MKGMELMRAIGNIADKYIEENVPGQKAMPAPVPARKPMAWRLAPIAACLALAMVATVVTANRLDLFHGPHPPVTTSEPSPALPLLAIGEAKSAEFAQRSDLAIAFDLGLTQAQLEEVFPGLDLMLGATAYYRDDGSLYFLTAMETKQPGRTDLPLLSGEYYNRTTIQVSAYGAVHSDCVLVGGKAKTSDINGVTVEAFKFLGLDNDIAYYQADFLMDGIGYRVSLYDSNKGDAGAVRLTEIVHAIIAGGKADLSSIAKAEFPNLRFDQLTLGQAHEDPEFGGYIPSAVPDGLEHQSSYRICNPMQNSLSAHWAWRYKYVEVQAEDANQYTRERLARPGEREKYDMSLYSIPWADSIPDYLWEIVQDPVFLAEELSLELIRARVYIQDESGEGEGPQPRADFNVLYGDVLVSFSSKGLSAQQLWEMVQTVG